MRFKIVASRVWYGMKRSLDLPSSSAEVRAEALIEVERRAFLGAFVYLPSWIGIAVSTGVVYSAAEYASHITLILTAIVGLRLLLHVYFGRLVRYSELAARMILLILVLGAGLVMGLVATASIFNASLHPALYSTVVVCGVLCTGGTLILSIDPAIRFGMPIAVLGPLVPAFAIDSTTLGVTFSILLLINIAYLIIASRRAQFDYWDGARSREMLKEQVARFEKQSLTDGLTQIPNRLCAMQRLSEERSRSLQEKLPLTVLMVDIDHFKSINDSYGHLFGDECLIAVASTLKAIVREPDFLARYGGEEFVVALVGATEQQGLAIAERLRNAIASVELCFQTRKVNITCSIGVATVIPSIATNSVEGVIGRADAALYRAKEDGRNRVVTARTNPVEPSNEDI